MIPKLLHNIRFYVLSFSILLSVNIYFFVLTAYQTEQLRIIRLTQIYALTSLTFLYLALLAGPFCYTFREFPYRSQYLKSRRALGVSAFYFGLLHSSIAFFGQLGGVEGLGFLSDKYLLAIILSFTALVILLLLTITSFDYMVVKLKFHNWKLLHRFVYLAGILILTHALMLGTHFSNLSTAIPQIFFGAFAFLGALEAIRFDAFLQKKVLNLPRFGITGTVVIGFIVFSYLYSLLPAESTLPLGIHNQHIEQAKNAQSPNTQTLPSQPGMQGDKSLRYTVSFTPPQSIEPNQEVDLRFKVYNANNGNQVTLFNKLYTKSMHLIVVDNELAYYNHIHPEQQDAEFAITTQFPKPGLYRLYIDYQPVGAIEQQMAFSVRVGTDDTVQVPFSTQPIDKTLTKTFGDYTVTLTHPTPLKASDLSVGKQTLTFAVKDKNGLPVKNLKPYLGAFGHLVMIDQERYNYLHVHPTITRVPNPSENGGPTVEFMPLGINGPIKPGIYRVFAQFNPNNNLFTNDFTIKIE